MKTVLLLSFLAAAIPEKQPDLKAVFLGNHDGDTIKVRLLGEMPAIFSDDMSIRIFGIDTAEMTSKKACELDLARRAKQTASAMFAINETITLKNCQKDKYFRLLCDVENTKGEDVAKKMLSLGLAQPYAGDTKLPFKCQ